MLKVNYKFKSPSLTAAMMQRYRDKKKKHRFFAMPRKNEQISQKILKVKFLENMNSNTRVKTRKESSR